MNENEMNAMGLSDVEVLDGIRRRLSGIEPLIPAPPAWQPTASAAVHRTRGDRMDVRVRPRGAIGFGGAVATMLVAVIVIATLGVLGARNSGSSGSRPTAFLPVTTIVYELVPPNGVQLTSSDLDATLLILKNRLNATGAGGVTVAALPPDQVSVSFASGVDPVAMRSFIGQTGSLEFVLLPPETYGTSDTPGVKPVPATGQTIDPALPAQFTGADLDPNGFGVADVPNTPGGSVVDFAFKPSAATRFATWTGQHVHEYFAIVLDGVVVSVPYIFSEISEGRGEIAGNFTAEDARQLETILKYGRLPFPLQEVSSSTSTPAPATSTPIADLVPIRVPSGWTPPAEISSPGVTHTPAAGATFLVYVVRSGDTLSAIANRFNVSLASLEAANPGIDPQLLQVGMHLNIPAP